MDTETRRSDSNGIWLCQTCAKRVDSDAKYYSPALLLEWKAEAERHALAQLGVRGDASFYPQPLSAKHTPIPRIAELTYDAARIALMDAGWQPVLRHWADADSLDIRHGNGPYFWEKGYREIRHAYGTGVSVRRTHLELKLRGDNDPVQLTNSWTRWIRRTVASAGATAQS